MPLNHDIALNAVSESLPEPFYFFEVAGQKLFPVYGDHGDISTKSCAIIVHHLSDAVADGGDFGGPGMHQEHDSLWYVVGFGLLDDRISVIGKINGAVAAMELECLKS